MRQNNIEDLNPGLSLMSELGRSRVASIIGSTAALGAVALTFKILGCGPVSGSGPETEITQVDVDSVLDNITTPGTPILVDAEGHSGASIKLEDRAHFKVFGWSGPSDVYNDKLAGLTKRSIGIMREGSLQVIAQKGAFSYQSYTVPSDQRAGKSPWGIEAHLDVSKLTTQSAKMDTVTTPQDTPKAYYDPSTLQHVLGNVGSSTQEAAAGTAVMGDLADTAYQASCTKSSLAKAGVVVGAGEAVDNTFKSDADFWAPIIGNKAVTKVMRDVINNPIRIVLDNKKPTNNGSARSEEITINNLVIATDMPPTPTEIAKAIGVGTEDIKSVSTEYNPIDNCKASTKATNKAAELFRRATLLLQRNFDGSPLGSTQEAEL